MPTDIGMQADAQQGERRTSQIVFFAAVSLSVFQLYQSVTGAVPATYLRPVHLSWVLALVFLQYPLVRRRVSRLYPAGRVLDVSMAALACYAGYIVTTFDYQSIDHILYGLTGHDFLIGTVFVLLLLEAARRSVGWIMVALGTLFIGYASWGSLLPDAIAHRGFSLERIIRFQIFTADGVFGVPLGIAAGTVFIFVLFGSFLEVTGAGKFFIDLAFALAGRYRGGPAKASVIASAAMGSISGSAIANTVTTGSLTIPMMKKLGYRAEQAAGIEAAASTGGQIMPPIMGAGAFIMAEFTNTPYNEIVIISILPALLYFTCTLLYVHLMACKRGLQGMTERPPAWETLSRGFHFALPLAVITALLLLSYSPPLVGAAGCAAVLASSLLRAHTRVGLHLFFEGLRSGALMALPISVACATAGIIVGVIGQTGMGLQFTEFVVSLAAGQLWLALILIAGAALVLGMGLPVTAAYIVVAVMAAPALESLGVPLLAAHMIVFWLSQTSNVTPPIALAAFAGAGVAGANPVQSSLEAFKLAKGLFVIPLMMAYSDLLLVEHASFMAVLLAVIYTLVLIGSLAFAVEGYALGPVRAAERLLFASAGALVLHPAQVTHVLGLALALGTLGFHVARHRAYRSRAPR